MVNLAHRHLMASSLVAIISVSSSSQLKTSPIAPLFSTAAHHNLLQHLGCAVINPIMPQLKAGKCLNGRQVIGICLKRRGICVHGFVDSSGALKDQRQVHARIGVARHQLACPLKLMSRLVELALLEKDDAQIIVRRPVVEISGQRLPQEALRAEWIRVNRPCRGARQALRS